MVKLSYIPFFILMTLLSPLKADETIRLSFTSEAQNFRRICTTYTYIEGTDEDWSQLPQKPYFKTLCYLPQTTNYQLSWMSFLKPHSIEKGCRRLSQNQPYLNQALQDATNKSCDYLITHDLFFLKKNLASLTATIYHVGRQKRLIYVTKKITSSQDISLLTKELLTLFIENIFKRESIYKTKIVASIMKPHGRDQIVWFDMIQGAFHYIRPKHEIRGDNPKWSPDGDRFVYTSAYKNRSNLMIHKIGSQQSFRLTTDIGVHITPSWLSSDWIAFSYNKDHISRIEVINAHLGHPRRLLLQDGSIVISPQLSPDQTILAFLSDRLGIPRLFLKNMGQGETRLFSKTPGYTAHPEWHPNGQSILYTQERETISQSHRHEKLIMQPTKSERGYEIIRHPGDQRNGHWSPKGEFILYLSNVNYPLKREGSYEKTLDLLLYDTKLRTAVKIPVPFRIKNFDWIKE